MITRRQIFFALGLLFTASVSTHAQRPKLLPAPQEIRYADGALDTASLCATNPSDADSIFALHTLATGLSITPHTCEGASPSIQFNQTANDSAIAMPGDAAGPNSREAYAVTIDAHGIHISGRSSAAIFYGVETILQLASASHQLPFVTLHDWPTLPFRGTLVDAGSEGPMLTIPQIKSQLDLIARYKGNQYFFYSEGNIELRGYPLLNPDARFTQSQIHDIVAYAAARHIDVIPAVEMYAHLHDLFRIETYSHLADFPHGTQFDPNNPEVKKVLADWSAQLAALFPSRFVDIGFDETWSLSKAAANDPDATPVKLFIAQLTTVTHLFQDQGKTVMAYADIMVKFPGIIPSLPKGLIALPWWYDPIGEPEYKHWLAPLVDAGTLLIVTSGVTSWDQITPNYTVTFANIDTFLTAGQRAHSLGLVNTLWTDDGQALLTMSYLGIAYGSAAAWQSQSMQPATFFADYARLEHLPPAFATALAELQQSEDALERAIGRESMLELWRDPFTRASLDATEAHAEDLRQARLHAEAALTQLYALNPADVPNLNTFIVGARIIDLAGMKFLYANELDSIWKSLPTNPTRAQLTDAIAQNISSETHSRTMDMMDGTSELKRAYRQAWLDQYTPYRIDTALGRWDAEFQFWLRAQTNFETLRKNFKDGDKLPTLESLTR